MTAESNPAATAQDLFRQTMDAFQSAIRTGVQIQQDSTRRFAGMMHDCATAMNWQTTAQSIVNDVVQATQKNVDESIRLLDQNTQAVMKFWESAGQPAAARQNGEGWKHDGDKLWESALSALRNNTQVLLQANAKMLESWSQMAEEFTGRMREAVKPQQA